MSGMIDGTEETIFHLPTQIWFSQKVLLWCISKEYIFKYVRDKNIICLLQD